MLDRIEDYLYVDETSKSGLRWLVSRGNISKDSEAGYLNPGTGYYEVGLNGKKHGAHRLVWYLTYGEFPSKMLDHINTVTTDNRISNLREVTNQENQFNRPKCKGVYYEESRGKFKACLGLNGKTINLGRFHTYEEAREAYLQGKVKFHKISIDTK